MARARPASGGRSPDRAKDAAILEAARASFFERGLAASTIEDIAARAGVSKVTIYKRWEDKEALFEASVKAEMAAMIAQLDAEPGDDGSLRRRLDDFGHVLMRFLFSPRHVLLDRMLALDLTHSPQLARRFFDAGPGHCRARIAAMLEEAVARGEVAIDDPVLAAGDLLSLWRGFLEKELQFGVREHPDDAELRRRVERGTRLFLRMVAPTGGPSVRS